MSGPTDVTLDYAEARIGRAVRVKRFQGEDVVGRLAAIDDLARLVVESIPRDGPRAETVWVPLQAVASLWVQG